MIKSPNLIRCRFLGSKYFCSLYGQTSLHFAVENRDYLRIEKLLQDGAELNAKNRQGQTALALAVKDLFPDVVKILLNHNAQLNDVNAQKDSALWLAARQEHKNKHN